VVISTVLFAGIGVATILSRQIKEIPTVENEAAGFYLAETIADVMNKDDLEEFDCSSISFIDWCEGEKINDEYHISVKIRDNYYKFIKTIGETSSVARNNVFYFKNDKNWENVMMHYALYDRKTGYVGNHTYVGKEDMILSSSSAYPGYMEKEIDLIEGSVTIRAYFCNGTKDTINTCWDGLQSSTKAHDIIGIEEYGTKACENERTTDGICGKAPFIVYVNEELK
jgi:hypothetical protein